MTRMSIDIIEGSCVFLGEFSTIISVFQISQKMDGYLNKAFNLCLLFDLSSHMSKPINIRGYLKPRRN